MQVGPRGGAQDGLGWTLLGAEQPPGLAVTCSGGQQAVHEGAACAGARRHPVVSCEGGRRRLTAAAGRTLTPDGCTHRTARERSGDVTVYHSKGQAARAPRSGASATPRRPNAVSRAADDDLAHWILWPGSSADAPPPPSGSSGGPSGRCLRWRSPSAAAPGRAAQTASAGTAPRPPSGLTPRRPAAPQTPSAPLQQEPQAALCEAAAQV